MYAGRGAAIITGTLAATLTLTAAITLASCSTETGSTTPTSQPAASVVTIPTADTTGPTPTTTTPTSSTASSSPAAPSGPASGGFDVLANMPATAKQHTNAGAQAFARYYIEALNNLLMSPARGQLIKLTLPQCAGCTEQERILGENVDAGRRYSARVFQTLNVGEPDANGEVVDASTVTDLRLMSLVTTSPVVVTVHGSSTSKPAPGKLLIQWRLIWRDGQWRVSFFEGNQFTPPSS